MQALGLMIVRDERIFRFVEGGNMAATNKVLKEALTLKPAEKAELIDKLLSSLDKPDAQIDDLSAKEAENRIDAYERGEIKAVTLKRVLERYK